MEKTNRVLRNERTDVHIANIISQFVDMSKEDIFQVLKYRKEELRTHAPFLYEILCDIDTFHDLKRDRDREAIFRTVEKNIISNLPDEVRIRIEKRYAFLKKEDSGYKEYLARHEKAYRELIVMLYDKDIILTAQESIFVKANIAIQHKELPFPDKKWYTKKPYKGFDGKDIERYEMNTKLCNKTYEEHKHLRTILGRIRKDQGLYPLTEKGLEQILDSLGGWNYDKMDAFLYCISGPGRFLLDTKTWTHAYDSGPYEFEDEQVPVLYVGENGKYHQRQEDVMKYGKEEKNGSFLVARDI